MDIGPILPSAPEGVRGWPWSFEMPQDISGQVEPPTWPRITVVIPSYNQGQFIEETIRSVLHQQYPNLELMIFDGRSTDDTVNVIKKYASQIDYWESKSDRGQSHAINKGFQRATGEILACMNSDDIYTPGALLRVGKAFSEYPGSATATGNARFETLSHELLDTKYPQPFDPAHFLRGGPNPGQPAVLIARSTYEAVGPIDETLHASWDLDYWIRVGLVLPDAAHIEIPHDLAVAKLWEGNKASEFDGNATEMDVRRIFENHLVILDKMFRSRDLAPNLRSLRRVAYSREMIRYAKRCANGGRKTEAIKYAFLTALRYPLVLQHRSYWGIFRRIATAG